MINKICILLFLIVLSISIGCIEEKDTVSPPIERSGPQYFIRGNVILENQTSPAHCPVIFDKFLVGTITDSIGNYELFIPDSLAHLTGTFKVYYYLYDYDLDSLSVKIENGKVVWGQENVNDEGLLKTVNLKQIISLEVTSDKNQYMVGEKVRLSVKMTNKSKRILRLHSSTVSWIGFYNINTKTTVWGAPGAVTTDHPRINQGEFINLGAEQEIKEIGHGYFVTVYSLDRGYNIPIAIKDFIWNSRFRYENLVTTGHSFFVFIDDPKNLNFPLVNVIQN